MTAMAQVNDGVPRRTVREIVDAANGRFRDAFLKSVAPKSDEVATACLGKVLSEYRTSPRLSELSQREAELDGICGSLSKRIDLLAPMVDPFASLSSEVVEGDPHSSPSFSQPCGIEEIDEHIRVLNRWREVYARDLTASGEVEELIGSLTAKLDVLKQGIERLEKEIKDLETASIASKVASFLSSKPKVENTGVSAEGEDELTSQSVVISHGLFKVIGRVDIASAKSKKDALELKQKEVKEADALLTELRAQSQALVEHLNNVREHIDTKVRLISGLPQTLLDATKAEMEDVSNNLKTTSEAIEVEIDRLCNLAQTAIDEVARNFETAGAKIAERLAVLLNFELNK
ncbi:TPA: hypothetical protein HA238_04145 [Candidatus Micrarchaeota archaeon]|nr:hypothetical protein [Candidatus Micrarchaeota archaeon]